MVIEKLKAKERTTILSMLEDRMPEFMFFMRCFICTRPKAVKVLENHYIIRVRVERYCRLAVAYGSGFIQKPFQEAIENVLIRVGYLIDNPIGLDGYPILMAKSFRPRGKTFYSFSFDKIVFQGFYEYYKNNQVAKQNVLKAIEQGEGEMEYNEYEK